MSQLVKDQRSKISVTVPTIFLKLWENGEETILSIVTEPFFRKKNFPWAPGVKTGGFLGQIVDEPFRGFFLIKYICVEQCQTTIVLED